ncbi:MAG: hypothetical protein RMK45_01985 [Armatimonadota bacterium]|nr:hypothetical protein [Armatimonadota bacterium]
MRAMLIACLGLWWLCAVAQERPLHWLQRAQHAESTLAVAGVRIVELELGRRSQRIEERFWRQGTRVERIEIIAPPARQGEVLLLCEGRWLVYRPRAKEAYELPHSPLGGTQLLQRAIALLQAGKLQAEILPDSRVAGRSCVTIRLSIARPASAPSSVPSKRLPFPLTVTLWIDKETGLLLRREVLTRPNAPALRTEIVQLELNPRLSPELFVLPPGVAVRPLAGDYKTVDEAQRAVPFPIRTPTYLPPQTELERVLVRRRPPQATPVVILHYRSPQGRFSLFQAYQMRDLPLWKPRKSYERLNTLFWREGDYAFGLIGDLPQTELKRIAESFKRSTL